MKLIPIREKITSRFKLRILFTCFLQPADDDFEAKLRKQRFESEVDSKWLQQEEINLVGDFKAALVFLYTSSLIMYASHK